MFNVREDEAERVIIVEDVIKPYLYLLLGVFKGKQNITFGYEKQAAEIITYVAISCVFFRMASP